MLEQKVWPEFTEAESARYNTGSFTYQDIMDERIKAQQKEEVTNMDIELELNKAHGELQELYRGGSTNQVRIKQLWQRIDTLESYKEQFGDGTVTRRVVG